MFKSTKFSLFALLAMVHFSLSIFAQDADTDNEVDADEDQIEKSLQQVQDFEIRACSADLFLVKSMKSELIQTASALTDVPGVGSANFIWRSGWFKSDSKLHLILVLIRQNCNLG